MLCLRTETEASVELAETALWYERQRNVPKDLPARRVPVRRFPFHVVYLELSDEWDFIGGGIGIHWEEIDEDISVASLLNPEKFMRLANSYEDFPVKKTKSGPAPKKRTTRKSANKR